MSNSFDATCTYCKQVVPAGTGTVKRVGKGFNVRHAECVGKIATPVVTQIQDGQYRVKKAKEQRPFDTLDK